MGKKVPFWQFFRVFKNCQNGTASDPDLSSVVPEQNKRLWLISKVYKKRFLRPVKILYFCLGWVEILMTPLPGLGKYTCSANNLSQNFFQNPKFIFGT